MQVSELPIRPMMGFASLALAVIVGAKVVPLLGPARTIEGDPVASLRELAARGRCEPRDDVRARSLLRKACVYGGVPRACSELDHLEPS